MERVFTSDEMQRWCEDITETARTKVHLQALDHEARWQEARRHGEAQAARDAMLCELLREVRTLRAEVKDLRRA